jgi:hypothetical protein
LRGRRPSVSKIQTIEEHTQILQMGIR